MAKAKTSDTLALEKSKQKKVAKKTNKLKRKIKDGKVTVKRLKKSNKSDVANRGLIYIGHIPHGFYENEMNGYFKQFGAVTNTKVCRSNKSGKSKGYGYVEFSHEEVAKIAAETMNNYLMFKKKVVAEYVPSEKRPKNIFKGSSSTVTSYSSKRRMEKQREMNSNIDEKTHLKRSNARLSKINKKLKWLQEAGIDYDFKPVELPKKVDVKKELEVAGYTFVQDPYDSDIEIKVPLRTKSRTLKSPEKAASSPNKADETLKTPAKTKLKTPNKKLSPKSPIKIKLKTPKSVPKKIKAEVTPKSASKKAEAKVKSPKSAIKTPKSALKKATTELKMPISASKKIISPKKSPKSTPTLKKLATRKSLRK